MWPAVTAVLGVIGSFLGFIRVLLLQVLSKAVHPTVDSPHRVTHPGKP